VWATAEPERAIDGAANTRHGLDTRRRALSGVRMSQESSLQTDGEAAAARAGPRAAEVIVALQQPLQTDTYH